MAFTLPEDYRDKIAAEIRDNLAALDLTQRKVAAILGLPQQSVQKRYVGETPWRAEELVAIAKAMDVPVSQVMPDDVAERAS